MVCVVLIGNKMSSICLMVLLKKKTSSGSKEERPVNGNLEAKFEYQRRNIILL